MGHPSSENTSILLILFLKSSFLGFESFRLLGSVQVHDSRPDRHSISTCSESYSEIIETCCDEQPLQIIETRCDGHYSEMYSLRDFFGSVNHRGHDLIFGSKTRLVAGSIAW